ncbi:MAG: efflux RND transporter permease subunit [Muribaculaceae bacterium]|nr:efflux RND transporter permease subunit [Muribaculaceae bacterium]
MKLDTFINRPVLSTVISIFIVLLGLIGLASLPITQFPDIAPPTISVSTTYAGANAQAVLNSVIAPLEESINGAEGMMYMSSSATNTGSASITVYFEQGFNPDMAAVAVQNRVAKAQNLLPAEVTRVGVLTQKRQTSMLVGIALVDTSGTYSEEFIENYMKINVVPQLQRISGVGDVQVMGADYSMRIWLKPDVMAQYNLMPSDISAVMAEQNIEAAPGAFGEQGDQTFQYSMTYKGRLSTPEEFGDIVVRANDNGEVLLLKDVADIEMGRVTYGFHSKLNGNPAVMAMVYQTAGSNATEIINRCLKFVDEIKPDLPKGMAVEIPMNNNDFLYASIHHVIQTLIEAFILVFFVVYIFLQDLRSTIIPAIAIPVALIGTFFMLNVIGFSLNLITLSALVLAIAIVVDDAIVVVEAVHAKLDVGYKSARRASIDAMNEIAGALVSITLVMMLVFIPVSFMGGTTGIFYRQFGLTIAVAVGFSAINALTLSPALCAVFLKAHDAEGNEKPIGQRMGEAYAEAAATMRKRSPKFTLSMHPLVTLCFVAATITFMVLGWYQMEVIWKLIVASLCAIVAIMGIFNKRFHQGFNSGFDKMLKKYSKVTSFFTKHKFISFGVVAASIAALVMLMMRTPSSLVPEEDTGVFFVMLNMPPGTSQERTGEELDKVNNIIMDIPGVKLVQMINGFSFIGGQGPTYGTFIVKLKDWEERGKGESANDIIKIVMAKANQIVKDGTVFAFAPPMITGYSATNGFEIMLQDKTGGSINDFFTVTQGFLAELNQQPEIQSAYTTFNPSYPMYMVDIDVAKCKQAGLSPSTILSTLQGYYGSMYVSNFNRFGKIYRVMVQAEPSARVSPETLNEIKVRNGSEMAPITNFVSLRRVYGADVLNRFNMFTSIKISGQPADGYSNGDAIAAIQRVAASTLPPGYGYEFSGMTREEATQDSSSTAIVFGLCLLFVYLLLSAQYESYFLPFAVILSIPFGLMGSFIFANMLGIDNNIYLQIALIMLIGLLAKNAILIVEFAVERRRSGMSIFNAAIAGASARLRPILMTSLALIIGLLPMMFATGVGANGNRALGAGSIGGMLIGMILQIFIVPALFVAFQSIQEKVSPIKWEREESGGNIEKEIEQYVK